MPTKNRTEVTFYYADGIEHYQEIRDLTEDELQEMMEYVQTSEEWKRVKHGRWVKMSDSNGIYWACSECGEDIPRISHFDPQFDSFPRLESIDKTIYCPNCGARMDEVTE